ncbi:DUF945 family protein [Duganella sp. sic0402]|uniref:DUF945 family protein n=1 Tax=Duganella sp. sic0402 TaxID=2854786 RepID=UPI001C485A27|nr:DUF945 family protein [Duganella sp. sic0402]
MASAVLAIPSYAAATKAPAPSADSRSVLAQVAKELDTLKDERNYARQLDRYAQFEFSPELRPKLKEIFGTERPFPLERAPDSVKGQINYVGKLAAHSYKVSSGSEFSWTEASADIATDKSGRPLNITASWPSVLVTGPGSTLSAVNMGMTSKMQRGADGVAYGNTDIRIGAITARGVQPGSSESKEAVRLDGVSVRSDMTRRGATAETGARFSVDAIVLGAERVERANFAFRVTKIPANDLVALDKALRNQDSSKPPSSAQFKEMMTVMQDFGKRWAIAGATLFIDDISASYRGNVASIKGNIGFQKVVEADFKSPMAWAKKIVGRFDVRVPVALVKDVARAAAAKSVNPAAPDAAKQIESSADAMSSVMIGKAVSNGFAVIEKGELRSAIEIKNGKLQINGKDIDVAKQLQSISGAFLPRPAPVPPVPTASPEAQPEPAAE